MKILMKKITEKNVFVLAALLMMAGAVGCTTTEVAVEEGAAVEEGVAVAEEGAKDGVAKAEGDAKEAAEPASRVVGEVSLVDNDFNYIILKASGKVEPDSELIIVRGKKQVGVVKVSAPRRDSFISADILEGKIKVGDIAKTK
jgi:hypothetical protein